MSYYCYYSYANNSQVHLYISVRRFSHSRARVRLPLNFHTKSAEFGKPTHDGRDWDIILNLDVIRIIQACAKKDDLLLFGEKAGFQFFKSYLEHHGSKT